MPDSPGNWLWWLFSSVLLSFAINLVSDYLKPHIEGVLEYFSKSTKIERERRKANYRIYLWNISRKKIRNYKRLSSILKSITFVVPAVAITFSQVISVDISPGLTYSMYLLMILLFVLPFVIKYLDRIARDYEKINPLDNFQNSNGVKIKLDNQEKEIIKNKRNGLTVEEDVDGYVKLNEEEMKLIIKMRRKS